MGDEFNRLYRPEGWSTWGRILLPDAVVEAQERHLVELQEADVQAEEEGDEEIISSQTTATSYVDIAGAPELCVVDAPSVAAFEKRTIRLYRDSDDRNRARAALTDLRRDEGRRRLAQIAADWPLALRALEEDFPNFHALVDMLRCAFSLAELRDRVPFLPPILLDGPPGIGKTYVVDRIAHIFGAALIRVSMETAQSNSILAGSSTYWSNTSPGEVFKALVIGTIANPVILLDEVDKVSAEKYDPLSSLYSLLDRRQARVYSDLSFPDVKLDASRITWILTSNEADLLPAPILTRVRRLNIPAPTRVQCKALAHKIFGAVRRELLNDIPFDSLRDEVCERLAGLPPRIMEQTITEAIGRALYAGRRYLATDDIRLPPAEPRIGFI